jgi:dipeptidase
MRSSLILVLISAFSLSIGFCQNETGHNCFTILVGRGASTDGSVFVAHNEDDLNDHNFVDLHKVPRIRHHPGERQVFLNNTDSVEEVAETYAYFWITGSKYAEDQYLNEWGVAITSNSSQSNVQNGNGKIDHNLRRIVIERARTAREAVRIAGAIVDRFGYATSGRVYSIADPNEAWVFEVANGKHWIARRVPDDGVVIVPNYYVIDDFQQADTANYLSSPDLIDYAVANGWYDPQKEASFNFRTIYGHHNRLDAPWNIARKWVILNRLSAKQYDIRADFPFSITPKDKISIESLIDALADHYEQTVLASAPWVNNGSPHRRTGLSVQDSMTVCNLYNDYSCITQLRAWLPPEIANVLWIAPRYPCLQPFIPWYYGINTTPAEYETATYREALANFNNKNRDYFHLYPGLACWAFDDFANRVDRCYGTQIESVRKWKRAFQDDVLNSVRTKERGIANLYKTDPGQARRMLTDITTDFAKRALRETQGQLVTLKPVDRP